MTIQLKRNDTKDTISYSMTYSDGTPVNLTGATVRFLMGSGKSVISNSEAVIKSASEGKVEYTLTDTDTLVAGTFKAEFEATFGDGKVKTFPTNGYILVNIQPNIDKNKTTYFEETTAMRVSQIELFKEEVNKEVKETKSKADEAIEVTKQLLDGSFETGALNTNIEQRLGNLESQYAPKLTEVSAQLAQTETQVESGLRYRVNEVTPRFQSTFNPMVTFVSDDIDIMDYDPNVKSAFIDNDIPCVLAAITGRIESSDTNTMTYAQLREMQDKYGYEISSHSHSHMHMTTLTDEEIDFECRESKRLLELNGLKVSTMCIPYGFYDNRVKQIAQKYYRGVRRSGNQVNPFPIKNLEIISYSTEFESLDACKAKVDEAIAKKRWLVFLFHAWSFKNSPTQLQNMKDVIAYIKTKNIDVVTLEQGMNKQSPVVDIGANSEFRLGQDGLAYSKQIATYYQDLNAVTGSTHIDNFFKDALNICPITTNRTTFPDNQSGLLLTYNFKSDEYGFQWQEYHLFNQSKSFRRRVNHVGTWLTWQQIATSMEQHIEITKGRNEYTGETLPNQLPVGKVINTSVSTNTVGMPRTFSGLLIINTTGLLTSGASDYGFITQEYIRYGTNEKWFRTAASGTAWNPWVQLTMA